MHTISQAALEKLAEFHWPGNVRELENVIERGCALARGTELGPEDMRLDYGRAKPAAATEAVLPEGKTLDEWEDEIIREAYRKSNGNKSQAARILGLSRNALRYRLEKIGIADAKEAAE